MPSLESQTILDVVTWIQRNADPKLTYRFACRVGMCGSCAMLVNGKPCWTCGAEVQHAVLGGRKIFHCPVCQPPKGEGAEVPS